MSRNIALYMRLSIEDENEGLSESIVSQKNLIKDFILNDKELKNYNQMEFIDDGYSGYNMNRPAITDLIEKIRDGEINCIIVKDISRFGRNNLEVLPYIERIFPFMGVRFISILDKFDTSKNISTNSAMDISVKSMMNDFYVKDLSKKMKAIRRLCAEKGEYTSGTPVFGYKTCSKNKKIIVIDKEPADIVKRIFNYALDGKTTGEIAKILNKEKVITPLKYKRETVFKNKTVKDYANENYRWTNSIIKQMLKNEMYIGTFIAYKRIRTKIKSNNSVANDKANWIKIENSHEAIINKDIFKKVNKLENKSGVYVNRKAGMFARKVFCGHCGKTMRNTDRNRKYFRCISHQYTEDKPCLESSIAKVDIEKLVLEKLKKEVKKVYVPKKSDKKIKQRERIKFNKEDEIKVLEIKKTKVFEKFVEGSISQETFISETEKIEKKCRELNITEYINDGEYNSDKGVEKFNCALGENNRSELFNRILESDLLTKEMMQFVKVIKIFSNEDIEIDILIN